MATVKRASLNPDNFSVGGLINDVDVEVTKAEFTLEKPENYPTDDRVFFRMGLKDLDSGTEVDQFWPAGSNDDFQPGGDEGEYLLPTGSKESIGKSSKAAHLFNSFVTNGGMPKGKLDEDGGVSLLVGSKIHVQQVPWTGMGAGKNERGQEKTILICSKAIAWAWDKKGGSKKSAAAAGSAKSGTGSSKKSEPEEEDNSGNGGNGSDNEEIAVTLLKAALKGSGDEGKSISLAKKAVFQQMTKDPKRYPNDVRNAITKMVGDEEWLMGRDEFNVDDGNVALI